MLQAQLTILNRNSLHYVLTAVNTTSYSPSFMFQFKGLSSKINEPGRPVKETSERGDVKCLGLRLCRKKSSFFYRNETGIGEREEKNIKAGNRSCNHCCRGKTIIFSMCVCRLRYPACDAHVPYCHLWSANSTIFFHIIT